MMYKIAKDKAFDLEIINDSMSEVSVDSFEDQKEQEVKYKSEVKSTAAILKSLSNQPKWMPSGVGNDNTQNTKAKDEI